MFAEKHLNSKRLHHKPASMLCQAVHDSNIWVTKTAAMKKLYNCLKILLIIQSISLAPAYAQVCASLTATATGYESRCAATGSIKIIASGGSGSYKYRTVGPVTTNYTSTDSITGLSAGTYTVFVNDIITNCTFGIANVVVAGAYQDPRFTLYKVDVTCDNGANGSIALADQQYGLSPFTYTIVAPSPMGVGTTNNTGSFNNLSAGTYSIQLTDSCGGIQTRQVTINNYSWNIIEYPFTKISCYEAQGYIKVADSRGNISTVSGIPGFSYGIVMTPGDTVWSSSPFFNFFLFGTNSFQVVAKDTCGIVKAGPVTINLDVHVGADVLISNQTCSTFTATLQDVRNFFNGQFCIYDSTNTLIECNATGVFNNLPYGSYCIGAYDMCADITIKRCFTATPPPIVIGNNVLVLDKTCTSFTAAISGTSGLSSPQFCLYDSANVQLACNSTGVFNNLPYGSYCINTKDGCRDTVIRRCFTALPPTPFIPVLTPSYVNCQTFGIEVGGDTLGNPIFCLYDTAGVLITCNNTGIFDSIPLGNYCVHVYDSCYDTTIIRCINVGMPVIPNDLVLNASHLTCTSFILSASGASLTNPEYCLYNAADSLLECNSTGEFDSLAYGSYCIRAHNECPDTIMIKCITVAQPIPSVDADLYISNRTCSTFRATVQDPQQLTNPQYCIYDALDSLIQCNLTGVFSNLPYGTYCIKITDGCYDTTILRCRTVTRTPLSLTVSASKSCAMEYAKFELGFSNATAPISVFIYRPDSTVFLVGSYPAANVVIDSIPGVPPGQHYTLIAQDACGRRDTAQTDAVASYFNFNTVVQLKCPGATWANGSGDVTMNISTNMGSITVRIIEKDGITYSPYLVPNTAVGSAFTFNDLSPGTYVLRSSESTCNRYVYDTITVNPYQFPNLDRSSAYQCDEGGFSISAVATNGVGPFTYSIIGSVPAIPSIIAGPQASNIFNVNNGTTYSLIRLRALDACGNATLGDASILPLTNNGIFASSNCMHLATTLSVDTIMNANYRWYKKANATAPDSVLVSTTPGVYIPNLLPTDTGVYVCYVDVNLGCIRRTYNFHLNGSCYIVLPVKLLSFNGRAEASKNVLHWAAQQEQDLTAYIVERQVAPGIFESIGSRQAYGAGQNSQYSIEDQVPQPGKNFYRLKMLFTNGSFKYSSIISVQQNKGLIAVHLYPNPVTDKIHLKFVNPSHAGYEIALTNGSGQVIHQQRINTLQGNETTIYRPANTQPGIYILRITEVSSNSQQVEKLIFR